MIYAFKGYEPDISAAAVCMDQRGGYGVKDTSHNLRLLLLSIRLLRPVKSLPSHLAAAERITRRSLAEEYVSGDNSKSEEAARKMASRHLNYMDEVFGLDGDEASGFVMRRRFETFREMFEFWLDEMGQPSSSDRRLHVMLSGILHAIDNGFTGDPVIIPNLAKALKGYFGSRNIRDTKEPLQDLFYNNVISSYLRLYEGDCDQEAMFIDRSLDPLLMRYKSRAIVGGNGDPSIILAMPGRIRLIIHEHIDTLDPLARAKILSISEAVRDSHAWMDEEGTLLVPYILYREGEDGPFILTVWNGGDGYYRDMEIDKIESFPASCNHYIIPYGVSEKIWQTFRQLAQ